MERNELLHPPALGSFCRYRTSDGPRVGVLTSAGVRATAMRSPLDAVRLLSEHADLSYEDLIFGSSPAFELESLDLLPPVEPRVLLYCSRNYEDHLQENPRERLPRPAFFSKLPSSVIGHNGTVVIDDDQNVDYEGELAVIIGRTARNASVSTAFDYIAGYTIANDISDRALQHNNGQVTMGKGADTFGPLGPFLVPRDAIDDVADLRVRTWVDGEQRQSGNTGDMIHGVAQCIETATRTVTLRAGDVIATGTPAGVGAYMDPPKFLKRGGHVSVNIDYLGTLSVDVTQPASDLSCRAKNVLED